MSKYPIKMWLVTREVLAKTIVEAVHNKGRIYEIKEASKEYQPQPKINSVGFKEKKNGKLKK